MAIYWSPISNTILSFIKSQSKLDLDSQNIPKIGSHDVSIDCSSLQMKRMHKKLVVFYLLGRLIFRLPSYYLPLTTTWQQLDKRAFFLCSGNTRIPVSTPTRSHGWKEIASINSFQRRPRSKIKNTFAFEPGTEKANTEAREQKNCQQNRNGNANKIFGDFFCRSFFSEQKAKLKTFEALRKTSGRFSA